MTNGPSGNGESHIGKLNRLAGVVSEVKNVVPTETKAVEVAAPPQLRETPMLDTVDPQIDWDIPDGELTKLVSDSGKREEIRRLLTAARMEGSTHSASSRKKLAEIKMELANKASQDKVALEGKRIYSQAEQDQLLRKKGVNPVVID